MLRAGLMAVLGLLVPPVEATFHFMQIEQVIGGVNGDTAAQAIQLRMRTSAQNQVSQARIYAWDANGANPVLIINFAQNVPNATTGDRVLIGTPAFVAMTSPNAVANFMMTNPIPVSYLAAGSLTFEDDFETVYWRLSWGGAGYTGSTLGDSTNDNDPGFGLAEFGPPFAGPLPSTTLQALRFSGAANALSTSNAADYSLTAEAAVFRNNARNNFTVVAPEPILGDIDGDGDVDLDDYVRCVGCLAGPGELMRPAECSESDFMACDIEPDGDVDVSDFAELSLLTSP